MKERKEAVAACLALGDVYEDHPFEDQNWTLMRHCGNKKTFAAIYRRQGRIWINCKAAPDWNDYWQQTYAAVVPGYHMNKLHWCSIILDGSMSDEEIMEIIEDSYHLTRPKLKKRPR